MKNYLNDLPKGIRDLICLASDIASKNNLPAYLVGGFVRDLLLGVKNLDLDIVVEYDGIRFAEVFASKLGAKLIRHRRFGTATIILKPNLKIDVATARKETYPKPASLPLVTSGTLRDDLKRRDFTINAMAMSINDDDFGRLIDLFGGKNDLRDKKIRVLHNLSFIDDPTRILRAVRFEKRYDFKIETKTLTYLKEAVVLKMLGKVQCQRLRDELILILKEEQPLRQLKRIQELAGLGFINQHLSITEDTCRLLYSIEKQINWFKGIHPQRRALDTWLIYLIGLIGSLGINEVKKICRCFVFRKGEEKRILAYKKLGPKFILTLSKSGIKPSRIFRLLEPLSYELIILIKAKYKNRNLHRRIEDFFEIYNGMRLFVSGDDLRRLGVLPGPFYQKIFTEVLNAKIEGRVHTRGEELELIKQLIRTR